MLKAERYRNILAYFAANHPNAVTELIYNSPFELLVSVILSAQCTDKRVNLTTPKLFKAYPTALAMSKASFDQIFEIIRSISYPNSKAKYLIATATLLVAHFNSKIPTTVEELQTLPGVGRKTANVIVSVLYNKSAMAVDTHVFRVSARIGLTTNAKTPLQTELQLIKNIPAEQVHIAHHWLILHGRYICIARNPKCGLCNISKWCKHFASLKQ
jgi:endonuclease-3